MIYLVGEQNIMNEKACFIIGLPNAGKTTYLAALSYALMQKKTKTKLHFSRYSGNQQYFAKLANVWLEATEVARTSKQIEQASLLIDLVDDDHNPYVITFPDLSGETFQRQYVDREMEPEIALAISNSDSVILFVNPTDIKESTLIPMVTPELRAGTNCDEPRNREPIRDDPTAVVLVELLSFISFIKKDCKIRLTIVVSAWDTVNKDYAIPEECIKNRMPLLWQYVCSNPLLFDCTYYGVSAQGGDLKDEEASEALLEKYQNNPAERVSVVDNNGKIGHDISLPLWTAMNLN